MKINEFINELNKLGINVTSKELDLLNIYKDFLRNYNKHTNLTTITNDEDIYLKHFFDSLTIAKVVDLNDYNTLLDVGSGAGFPGMVLKIFYPHLDVTLIDSNGKKTTFLNKLKDVLKLDVNIINNRVEEYSKDHLNKFDIVTSRAVANLRVLSELCVPLVKLDGLFIPLKGLLDEKLEDSLETLDIMNCELIKRIEFELYNNNGKRNIITIKKKKLTQLFELRSYDKILKKPLKKDTK